MSAVNTSLEEWRFINGHSQTWELNIGKMVMFFHRGASMLETASMRHLQVLQFNLRHIHSLGLEFYCAYLRGCHKMRSTLLAFGTTPINYCISSCCLCGYCSQVFALNPPVVKPNFLSAISFINQGCFYSGPSTFGSPVFFFSVWLFSYTKTQHNFVNMSPQKRR